MSLSENIKKISLLSQLVGAFNGKKTMLSTVVAIVCAVWSMALPIPAPTPDQVMTVVDQGNEIVQVVQSEVFPRVLELLALVAAFFSGVHAQSKIGLALKVIIQLVGKWVDLDDLKDPQFADKIKNSLPVPPTQNPTTALRATPIQSPTSGSVAS